MKGKVFVVCAMDTEGPIDNPKKPDILNNWDRVGELVHALTRPDFRMKYPDSLGHGLVYSWFILTLTGFKSNPFNRPMDYHLVYDYYLNNFGKNFAEFGDSFEWHYHQPSASGIGNEWCRDWTQSTEYFNILARMLLERGFFPTCYRAGGRIEDNDLSAWLEQWMPFDYSNCSGNVNWDNVESDGKKLIEISDWSKAPTKWSGYHPAAEDYQAVGKQKRWMFRCPDLDSPIHKLDKTEIRAAFAQAQSGEHAVLSFFEHDRRMIVIDKIRAACQMIAEVAGEFPDVEWQYKSAKEAAVLSLGLSRQPAPKFDVRIKGDDRLYIESQEDIFGTTPFLCVQSGGQIVPQPLYVIGKNKWITGTLKTDGLDKVAVAANSPSGEVGIGLYFWDKIEKQIKGLK